MLSTASGGDGWSTWQTEVPTYNGDCTLLYMSIRVTLVDNLGTVIKEGTGAKEKLSFSLISSFNNGF